MIRVAFIALTCPGALFAQTGTTAMDCVPPLTPELTASQDLLRNYGPEIRVEFSQYFDDAQSYIRCLQAANDAARAEVNEVLAAYTTMFPDR